MVSEKQEHDIEVRLCLLEESLERLEAYVRRAIKRDWGILAAWAAVVVGALGAINYIVMEPMASSINATRTEMREHEKMFGHPGIEVKLDRLARDMADLRQDVKALADGNSK